MIPYSPEMQIRSFTIWCSLVSYQEYFLFKGSLTHCKRCSRDILNPDDKTILLACLYVNSDKTGFMYLKKNGVIFTLNGKPLKLLDQFIYLGSNIFTESDVSICIGKTCAVTERLLIMWKSDLFDPIYPTPPHKQDMTQGQFLSGV